MFRLNDINVSDLVVEQPVMTLRAQKSQRHPVQPSNIRAQLMQNFQGTFDAPDDQQTITETLLPPPRRPVKKQKSVSFQDDVSSDDDARIVQANAFYQRFDLSKRNPFLAHQNASGHSNFQNPLNVQEERSSSEQADALAQRFPPKYRPQPQIRFGKLPMAEAENMASNMTVSGPGNPSEERQSALLRIQSVSRGQKPGMAYQNAPAADA